MTDHQSILPTTIVNGFLGSGKTTIISHLIDQLILQKEKVVYVKNEIGETDLDAQLMRGKNIIAKELLNGCICCTLVGPFLASINELISTYQPDRIIIESAGSADPASLALMVDNHPNLKRDGVVSIIDVINFNGYDKINHVTKRQAEFTDLIIFNKVELVDQTRKMQVVGYVREINEKSPIIEAKSGQVDSNLIFGITTKLVPQIDENEHSHHDEDDEITAFTYQKNKEINKSSLKTLLQNLPKNIFRVKGFFVDNGKVWIVNHVFNRTDFEEMSTDTNFINQSTGQVKLIFIGYKPQDNQAEIVKDLENI
jgi:G3E family GTPase